MGGAHLLSATIRGALSRNSFTRDSALLLPTASRAGSPLETRRCQAASTDASQAAPAPASEGMAPGAREARVR